MATQLDTRDQIDTRFSELIRHFDDEVKCQAEHEYTNTVCSGDVVAFHVQRVCGMGGIVMCAAGVRYVAECGNIPLALCAGCNHPVRDCWTVTPI